MEKLTSILAVLEEPATAGMVVHKAAALAQSFDARLKILAVEPLLTAAIAPTCGALGYPDITIQSAPLRGHRLDTAILREVQEWQPDLVVKFRAGRHPLRRFALAESDWRLSRECPVPLMLVEGRTWATPIRFAAAVDVSDEPTLRVARAIVHAAGFLALGSRGNLDILYTERELHDDALRMERAVKLAQLVREYHVGCERLQMFDGAPEKRLPSLIAARQYDVLLLGAVSHRDGLWDAVCPLTARLVDAATGDVVLVKEHPASRREARQPRASTGEQAAHQVQQFV
jgi:universal stress protein family protein